MSAPTRESVVCRILSCALQGVAGELGRIRWALYGATTPGTTAWLDRTISEVEAASVGAENEANRLEYQATLDPKAGEVEP